MENEKVSVIMGIYNCADTLPEAIESIVYQTYSDWELIMCDDNSTDNTYEVAKEYGEKYPDKIILIKNEKNSRLAFTLNHCLKYATGKYIARMDGDDKCVLDRFEKQIKYLKSHPGIDLVSTAMQRFDGEKLGSVDSKLLHPDKFTLRKTVPFNHATLMTYKYVYDKLNGYTVAERTKRGQDYDLWFRFFAEGFNGDNMPEPLYWVREDEAAIRRRTAKERREAFQTTKIGYKLLEYPKWWIIRPFIMMVIKSLVPVKVVEIYRNMQARAERND